MKIKNLETYGEKGYLWTVVTESEFSNEMVETQYRTDAAGEGLWSRERTGQDWRQCAGTIQFNLRVKDVRGKIRRELSAR